MAVARPRYTRRCHRGSLRYSPVYGLRRPGRGRAGGGIVDSRAGRPSLRPFRLLIATIPRTRIDHGSDDGGSDRTYGKPSRRKLRQFSGFFSPNGRFNLFSWLCRPLGIFS